VTRRDITGDLIMCPTLCYSSATDKRCEMSSSLLGDGLGVWYVYSWSAGPVGH